MKTKEIFANGLFKQNPVLKLVLGTCSVLALSDKAINGIGMGLAVMFVLVCSNVIISLLRKIIPDRVRIPAYVMVIATFVTIVKMVLVYFSAQSAIVLQIYDAMGVYLPLIVVNCIILARAEAFASQSTVGESALDGVAMGLGYTLILTLMGIVREILGYGSIFGKQLWKFSIGFFAQPAGAFLTYGLFIAVFTLCIDRINKSRKMKLEPIQDETVKEDN